MIYAVIPARKGSERIPNKNMRLFHGKPLVEHAIDQALRVFRADQIIVNSDDKKILKLAEKKGVYAYDRPDELAMSETSMSDVLIEMVNKFPLPITAIVLLQPTSPLRKDIDIKLALAKFWANKKQSIATVSPNQLLNGAVFIYRADSISPNYTQRHTMPEERSIDIDTEIDWQIAEVLYEPVQ